MAISLFAGQLVGYLPLVDVIRFVLTEVSVAVAALILVLIGLGVPADSRSLVARR